MNQNDPECICCGRITRNSTVVQNGLPVCAKCVRETRAVAGLPAVPANSHVPEPRFTQWGGSGMAH